MKEKNTVSAHFFLCRPSPSSGPALARLPLTEPEPTGRHPLQSTIVSPLLPVISHPDQPRLHRRQLIIDRPISCCRSVISASLCPRLRVESSVEGDGESIAGLASSLSNPNSLAPQRLLPSPIARRRARRLAMPRALASR